MSKFKSRLARRIMAIMLSGAMVMSNMSAYAAELTTDAAVEAAVEEETTAEETVAAESGDNQDSEDAEDNKETPESSEEKTSETVEETEQAEKTTAADDADKDTSAETETQTEVSTVIEDESTEDMNSSEEDVTEEETTEEEMTEVEEEDVDVQEPVSGTKNADGKIDVYDFGGTELDTSKYNNMFTKDYIKTWNPLTSGGTNVVRFDVGVVDGEETLFGVNTANTTTRVFFADSEIYDAVRENTKKDDGTFSAEVYKIALDESGAVSNAARVWMLKDRDSESTELYDYSGYITVNGTTSATKCISVKLNKGDIITLSVSPSTKAADGTEITYSFYDSDELINSKTFTAKIDEKKEGETILYKTYTVDKISFVAPADGNYKIYPTDGDKTMTLARAEVKPAKEVKVSGNLTLPEGFPTDDYGIKFVSDEGIEAEATIDRANNTYEVTVYAGLSYSPLLTNVDASNYKVKTPETVDVDSTDIDNANIEIEGVSTIDLSGEITGIDIADAQKAGENFKITAASDAVYVPEIAITVADDKITYTTTVERGVEYTLTAEGVNDYALKEEKLKIESGDTYDIEFEKKTLHDIDVTVSGPVASGNVKFTFTNKNEEGYVYTFEGVENIKLREGSYSVLAKAAGYKAKGNLSIDVKEPTEAVKNELSVEFEKASTWTFADADFVEDYISDGDYNGLKLTNVTVDIAEDKTKTAKLAADGKIEIPVDVASNITVEFTAAATGTFNGTAFETDGSYKAAYAYEGEAGTVTLATTNDAKISKITVISANMHVTTFELDPTKFVPTGADNTSIAQGTKLNTAIEEGTDTTGMSNYEKGYFKLVGTVNQRVSSNTGATTSFELGKAESGYIQFIVTGTATVSINAASTGGSNTSLFSLIGDDGKYVTDDNNKVVEAVTGTSATIITFTDLPEGTYKLVATKDTDENKTAAEIAASTGINRATRVLKITVAQTWDGNFVMTDWVEVAPPVITSVKLVGPAEKDADDKNVVDDYGNNVYKDEYPADTIAVSGTGLINEKDGAESITAEMYNEAGEKVASEYTVANEMDGSFKIIHTPDSSGVYTFKVFMSREGQEDKPAAETSAPKLFTLPLKQPVIKSATCLGQMTGDAEHAVIRLKWGEVKEADSYIINIDDVKYQDKSFPITELEKDDEGYFFLDVQGLAIRDEKYTFTVVAERTTEAQGYEQSEKSKEFLQRATADEKQEWAFVRYGTSTKDANNTFSGDVYDNNLQVRAVNNGGKIVPLSTDGVSFYYTTVPSDKNFVLEATAYVDSWTYSNGQEGFGLMAADTIGVADESDSAVWNNSYMVVATKIEYYWDGVKTYPSTAPSDTGDKINMYLGVGSIARTGAVSTKLEDGQTQPTNFKSESLTLENSCAQYGHGDYNIIGNMTNESAGKETKARITEFKFKITKNNTGYWMTYTDRNGVTRTNKYYDTTALSVIDPSRVYVGMFTARNATVTFKDVNMTIINPEDDEPAEDQPIEYSAPSYQVVSPNVTNTPDYDMSFSANWKGNISITDPNGNKVEITQDMIEKDFDGYNIDRLTTDGELLPYCEENNAADERFKIKIKLHDLTVGDNTYTITYSPDSTWRPQIYSAEEGKYVYNYYKELTTYATSTFTFTINYRMYGEEGTTLYVANNGKATGTGTYDNPLDIYTAVKHARPGQTIVLKEGRYELKKPLVIEKGISGKPSENARKDATAIDNGENFEKYIKMVAENFTNREHPFDASESKVVLDFGQVASGMTIAGDYWYLKGFDVTGSSDGNKGLQVSGNYNVLDQINTYKNGNTGIQISRYKSTDYTMVDWPTGNSILNCTSYLNADAGYEDADGFAAKLTIGRYNVFDGCIAAYNADDGWDFFAKAESGPIGQVQIRNSVTFKNGYVIKNEKGEYDINGTNVIDAGNGNGFKMGGESITGYHGVWNCLSFYNKAKGIDSNSCPDIQAHNSISFHNESYNVAFYTNNARQTDYESDHLISIKIAPLDEYGKDTQFANKVEKSKDPLSIADQLEPVGDQEKDTGKFKNETSYFYASGRSTNSLGKAVSTDWFESLEFKGPSSITRNSDGSINMHGFLTLKADANEIMGGIGLGSTPSMSPEAGYQDKETNGEIAKDDNNDDGGSSIDIAAKDETIIDATGTGFSVVLDDVDYDNASGIYSYQSLDYYTYYTGVAFKPVVRVYYGGVELEKKNYSVSYKNNVKAYTAKPGDKDFDEKTAPQVIITGKGSYQGTHTLYYTIRPFNISNDANSLEGYENQPNYLAATDITLIAGNIKKVAPTVTFLGKNFNTIIGKTEKIETDEEGNETFQNAEINAEGKYRYTLTAKDTQNFTGTRYVYVTVLEQSDKVRLISDAKLKSIKEQIYLGRDISGNRIGVQLADSIFEDLATIDKTTTLKKDVDYTVSYVNNEDVGIATVILTGTEGKAEGSTVAYYGSITANFKISAKKFNAKDYEVYITNSWGNKDDPKAVPQVPYAGVAITPTISVKIAGTNSVLTYGYDYTYSVKNNTKPGSASIVVSGLGYYSGKLTKTFKIVLDRNNVLDIEDALTKGTIKVGSVGAQDFVKGGVRPTPKLYLANGTTIDASNYTYSYKNNTKVGTAAQVIIKGKNYLKGSKNITFTINKKSVALMTTPDSDALSTLYKDKNDNFMPYKLTVKDGKKALSLNRDYEVKYYELVYGEENGVKVVKEQELSKGSRLSTATVHPTSSTDMTGDAYYTIKAVITGAGDYAGTKTITYRVVTGGDIRSAFIDKIADEYYVTGGVVAPEPVVTAYAYNGKTYDKKSPIVLKGGDNNGNFNYSLTYAKNDRAGTASITVTGKGNYCGSKKVSFRIIKKSFNFKDVVLVNTDNLVVKDKDVLVIENLTQEEVDQIKLVASITNSDENSEEYRQKYSEEYQKALNARLAAKIDAYAYLNGISLSSGTPDLNKLDIEYIEPDYEIVSSSAKNLFTTRQTGTDTVIIQAAGRNTKGYSGIKAFTYTVVQPKAAQ